MIQVTNSVLVFSRSGTEVSLSKAADAFAFEDDSSRDGLSPDQARSEDPQGSGGSTPDIKSTEAPLAGPLDTIQVKQTSLPHSLRFHIVTTVAGVAYSPLLCLLLVLS